MDTKQASKFIRSFFSMQKGRARYKTIRKRITAGAEIDGIHVCVLIVAMLIASIGLNVDSTEAIIGAMLICPLMGSVLAIAYGVATADQKLLRGSVAGLVMQMCICLATSTLYFAISPINNTTSSLLSNATPTIWDILIALVGGFAGGIGNSRREEPSTLIAGVAVATALMPPLCAAGFGIATHDLTDFVGAMYEFLLNVAFIAFGAEVVFVWLRVPVFADLNGDGIITEEERSIAWARSHRLRKRLIIGTLAFALPCFFVTANVVKKVMGTNAVFETVDTYDVEMTTLALEAVYPEVEHYDVGVQTSYDVEAQDLEEKVVATVITSDELPEDEQESIERLVHVNAPQVDEVEFETIDQA